MEKKNNINYGNDDMKKSFKVPENYFENFAASFEQQIVEQPVSVKHILRPWMYMAAMFLGVFFIAQILYTVYIGSDNKQQASQTALITENENYELYVSSQVNDNVFYEYLMDSDESSK